ncbi:uncharacterized protein Tco025E_03034 [Trypanosoma conorhini]|uniref:Uncharacterized protein n=1 Tax=Trypanosoma conorhini TaxID=83891 RepID=A0A422PZM5_9TRYP|nr:uncharacterized protein Tco025E_03034 [Trypanosoma conorhini]RNF22897.1 hypothetical protein Tco025E_03034 [Trypanosoma conorhini]
MSTWNNLAFAGYDVEKADILLKDSLGATYRLQPTWTKIERRTEIIQSRDDDAAAVEEFTESECSASYVSSASTCTSDESGDCVSPEDGIPKENVKAGATRGDCSASCVNDRGGAVPPVHGTLLTLKNVYTGEKETLPVVSLCTELTAEEVDSLYTVIVLGYREDGDVLLLPMPRLVLEEGRRMYRCLPALQLPLEKLYEYYDFNNTTDYDANRETAFFKLPLGEDAMTAPHLERAPLSQVYNVSTDRVYYLSAWSAYVQFVGVAWGVPWLRVFTVEDAGGGTRPDCGEEANSFSCMKPLPSCHDERQLCGAYGLCEWAQTTQTSDAVAAPVLPIADMAGEEEKWKSCWRQIREVGGGAVPRLIPTPALLPRHRYLSPPASGNALLGSTQQTVTQFHMKHRSWLAAAMKIALRAPPAL